MPGGTSAHVKAEGAPGIQDPCRGQGQHGAFWKSVSSFLEAVWGVLQRGGTGRIDAGS